MYIGGSVSQIIDLVDYIGSEGIEGAYGIPVINLKYYYSDNWEFRMGFQFSARTNKTKEVIPTFESDGELDEENVIKNYEGSNYTRFLPGAAYHFSSSNLLDVYVGAQMPIGWNSQTTKVTFDEDNISSQHQGSFVIGAGIFMGLQFFIADLPIAIGIEGGYSGHIVAEGVPSYKVKTFAFPCHRCTHFLLFNLSKCQIGRSYKTRIPAEFCQLDFGVGPEGRSLEELGIRKTCL
jgi:hypothetical protein